MKITPLHVGRTHPERVVGGLLLALGTSTMLGWITHNPVLFELVRGLLPMVFNTGAAFFLCGVVFCLSPLGRRAQTMRAAICLGVAMLMVVTLVEITLDLDMGVSLASLHTWYDYGNTRHGRMAPNTALAFLLISVALLMQDRVTGQKAAVVNIALTFAVMTIGLLGLVGYLLAPDLLFGWARSARMAVHTATGVIVASIGLWLVCSRSDWYTGHRFLHEGAKIRFLSAAVLVVVTLIAGLSGFVLLQRSFETTLEARLANITRIRGPWLQSLAAEMAKSSRVSARAAGLPIANSLNETAGSVFDVEEAARRLLRAGFRSVTFKDAKGSVLARFGSRSEVPAFEAPLDITGGTTLVWDQEFRIRSRHLLEGTTGPMTLAAESVEIESGANHIAPLLFDVGGLGPTAQVTACQRRENTLVCLPDRLNITPFTVPMKPPPQRPLPMQRALAETGPGIVHAVDYRGKNVIAAYNTLAPGLGFVAKQDAVEAYAPIRAALGIGAPIIILLAVAGSLAMYSQLNPLLRRMRRSEQHAAAALAKNLAVTQAVSEGILTLDEQGRIDSANAAAHTMLGAAPGQLKGLDFHDFLAEPIGTEQRDAIRSAVAASESALPKQRNLELQGLRSDGMTFPLELTLNAIPGTPSRLSVAVIRDITARKMSEEVLSRMAKFDALTGLPNRALFHDRLRTGLTRAARSNHPLALLFLDLDGFKGINDGYGHSAGDELLKQVAVRLTAAVRQVDTVARLAGDEFTIILEQLTTAPQDAEHVAKKVVGAIEAAFEVEGHALNVTVSIGIVIYDPRSEGPVEMSDLLKRADQSMYEVKRQGKNGFALAHAVNPRREPSHGGHASRVVTLREMSG